MTVHHRRRAIVVAGALALAACGQKAGGSAEAAPAKSPAAPSRRVVPGRTITVTPPKIVGNLGYFLPPEWVQQDYINGISLDLPGLQAYAAALVLQPERLNNRRDQLAVTRLYDCDLAADEFKEARDVPPMVARFKEWARTAKREGIIHMEGRLGSYDPAAQRFAWSAGNGQNTPFYTATYVRQSHDAQCSPRSKGGGVPGAGSADYYLKLEGVKIPGLALPPAQAEALIAGNDYRFIDVDVHFRLTGQVLDDVERGTSLLGLKVVAQFTGAEIKKRDTEVVLSSVGPSSSDIRAVANSILTLRPKLRLRRVTAFTGGNQSLRSRPGWGGAGWRAVAERRAEARRSRGKVWSATATSARRGCGGYSPG